MYDSVLLLTFRLQRSQYVTKGFSRNRRKRHNEADVYQRGFNMQARPRATAGFLIKNLPCERWFYLN